MNTITYGISEETYSYNGISRTAYGLVAYSNAEEDGTATIVASARDLTEDKHAVEALASRCNKGKLSLCHFDDIIEDFLS